MKKFIHHTSIGLRHTDATGVLFFAEQFKIALDSYEAFLKASGWSLKAIIEEGHFFFPVVHAESDYFAPLKVGDELEVALTIPHVGTSSFTCYYEFTDTARQLLVGKTTLVHVAVSAETRKTIPLPDPMRAFLT